MDPVDPLSGTPGPVPDVPPRPGPPSPGADWRDAALCRSDRSPDRWVDLPPVRIHGKNNPVYPARKRTLAKICAACPVADHCLWAALDTDVRGVFAGTDEYDRADLRDRLGLPHPEPEPSPETPEDARMLAARFTANRLALRGLTNTEIAAHLHVTTMTVSRLLNDPTEAPPARPPRRPTRRPTQSADEAPARAPAPASATAP